MAVCQTVCSGEHIVYELDVVPASEGVKFGDI